MKKTWILASPVAALILLGIALLVRREAVPELPKRPAPQAAAPLPGSIAAAPARPPSRPATPAPLPVKPVTEADRGRVLHQAALDQRVQIYVRTAMSGDQVTSDALRASLLREPVESKPVVQERLSQATLPREQELLKDLLRQLP